MKKIKRHTATVHEGKKPFKCESCDNSYTSKKALTYHIESSHERKKTIFCKSCDLSFRLTRALKSHIRSVHEEKDGPAKCKICNSILHSKSSLMVTFFKKVLNSEFLPRSFFLNSKE